MYSKALVYTSRSSNGIDLSLVKGFEAMNSFIWDIIPLFDAGPLLILAHVYYYPCRNCYKCMCVLVLVPVQQGLDDKGWLWVYVSVHDFTTRSYFIIVQGIFSVGKT